MDQKSQIESASREELVELLMECDRRDQERNQNRIKRFEKTIADMEMVEGVSSVRSLLLNMLIYFTRDPKNSVDEAEQHQILLLFEIINF